MEQIIKDIVSYMDFLKNQYNLEITICDLCKTVYPYFNLFGQYSRHRSFFCDFLKKTSTLQKKCVLKQSKIRDKCLTHDHFCGTCYAGMSEHIFRIMHDNVYIGFISVSGFCFEHKNSLNRIKEISNSYGLPYETVVKYFEASLIPLNITENDLKKLILPLQRMLELLYLSILTQHEKSIYEMPDALLNKILLYLNDNYTNPLTLEEIAADLHYSKSYICHYFLAKRNMTIMYYVNSLRMNRAKQLLEESNFSISEIAFQIGFNDANYFSLRFKEFFNLSPSQYRKVFLNKKTTNLRLIPIL